MKSWSDTSQPDTRTPTPEARRSSRRQPQTMLAEEELSPSAPAGVGNPLTPTSTESGRHRSMSTNDECDYEFIMHGYAGPHPVQIICTTHGWSGVIVEE